MSKKSFFFTFQFIKYCNTREKESYVQIICCTKSYTKLINSAYLTYILDCKFRFVGQKRQSIMLGGGRVAGFSVVANQLRESKNEKREILFPII